MRYVIIFTLAATALAAPALPLPSGSAPAASLLSTDSIPSEPFVTSSQKTSKNKRDDLIPGVVDDVSLILDGVGLTETLSDLDPKQKKQKRQEDDILTDVENLLASGENAVTGTVDSVLGLDGIFPVSSKRSSDPVIALGNTVDGLDLGLKKRLDSVDELVDEVESTVDSAITEVGLPSLETLGLEKRRDVVEFVDTVVVDAVGQVDTTLEAAPLLEGTVKEKRRDVVEFVDTVVVDAVGQVDTTLEAAPLLEGTV
jgi:hypothetical protein